MRKYRIPKTKKEFIKFYDPNINGDMLAGETWNHIELDGWNGYMISSCGRIYNTKTNKMIKPKFNNYSTSNITNKKYNCSEIDLVDLLRYTYYPHLWGGSKPHVNVIYLDKNIYNLDIENLKFVPNTCFNPSSIDYDSDIYIPLTIKGLHSNVFKPIYINGEKTIYYIDEHGNVYNSENNKEMGNELVNKTAKAMMTIRHNGIIRSRRRYRLMAETFIPNPYNFKYAILINKSDHRPSLLNICWSNRRRISSLERKAL